MGADRLKHIKDNAKRGWNGAGRRLADPSQLSLFDADPVFEQCSFRVLLKHDTSAVVGEQLLLHSAEGPPFITRGIEVISQRSELPAAVLEKLNSSGSLCVEVISLGTISNTIEVAPK